MGKLVGYLRQHVVEHNSASEWAKRQWTEAMELNAGRINFKRKKKIPDQPRYQDRIVNPSITNWGGFLNPGFISKKGLSVDEIKTKRARHIETAYEKWAKHLDEAYATVDGVEAKKFKDRVETSAEHYGKKCELGLRLTGEKVREYGPAVVIPMWLVGDPAVVGHIGPGDMSDGWPVNITSERQKSSLKSALVQRLIQAGAMIIHAGLEGGGAKTIKEETDRTNELVNDFVDKTRFVEFTTGGESHCDWGVDTEGRLYLEVKVTER